MPKRTQAPVAGFSLIFAAMYVLQNISWGFLLAAIGVAIPGLINMTAVNVSMKQGVRAGVLFSAGAAAVIFAQAFLAVFFAGYLGRHADILLNLKIGAIIIFFVLSALFFYQGLRPKVRTGTDGQGPPFLVGLVVAAMNLLNIPFYFTMGTFLQAKEWVDFDRFQGFFFASGAMTGAFLLLALYAYFAQIILERAQYLARNMNYILGGLFFFLALFQWVQLLY